MSEMLDLIPLSICLLAAFIDLRTREIPDALPLALVITTPLYVLWSSGSVWWQHLLGGCIAFVLAALLGRGDRFGGGDVKLFAALGLWFGLAAVIPLAMWIAIAGLPLAIIAALRKQKDFAYAPAILLGVVIHLADPDLINRVAHF